MNDPLFRLQKLVRRIASLVLPPLVVVISLGILAAQFAEFSTRNEILSLSSFIVLLSFSGLAFNWCRVAPSLTAEPILKSVYHAGIDLFLASLLALFSAFFAWLKTTPSLVAANFYTALFVLHLIFLFLALLLFVVAVLYILRAVKAIER